ncbi:MAG: DoxX family protein [Planctomycetota bacterium]
MAAGIFLQTLYFKFTGAPESVWIFEQLGAEPCGRYGSGVAELIASILILVPATTRYGAPLGAAIILGAIGSHLTRLGIEIQGDGGLLFGLAVTELIVCAWLAWRHWSRGA